MASSLIVAPCRVAALWVTGLLLCLTLPTVHAAPPTFSPDQTAFYEKQVRPILADNCYKCHSHESDKIKGDLLLDSREAALKGGATGPAIVPGDPDKSLLIKAVRHLDEDLQMPPKKKLTSEEIAILTQWVKMNAPFSESHVALSPKTKKITDNDRQWWAFQPVRAVPVPHLENPNGARNAIDYFVRSKLATAGLEPAPEADRRILIRRLFFDLLGLPPTHDQVQQFVADPSPDAFDNLVTRLLQDSRYGEKWARHWLDLVRYAESDGYKSDSFRPNAWRYRDYVVRSFNEDKPYDQFITEQLAADELWPNDPEKLIGLSYLRLWIYEYNQRNVKGQWASILNDITDVTADAFLGVSVQCARCHDHKFDPILQRDYYRLQAFFAPLAPRDEAPLASPADLEAYRSKLADWEKQTTDLRASIEAIEKPVRERTETSVIIKLPKEIQAIMHKPRDQRTPYEQQIYDLAYRQVIDENEKLDGKFKGTEKERLDTLKAELARFDSSKPKPLPDAMLVSDIGPVAPPVAIPKDKSQTPIDPGFLSVLDDTPARVQRVAARPESTGRRSTLARWIAASDNPLTARVFVNRVWQRHFGRGLVATASDFGHLGESPSNPELLDWLTRYFIDHHWSAKELHRVILTSATYRQSAVGRVTPLRADTSTKLLDPNMVDPENRLLWRQNLRRLESDQIRDALLWVTGELDPASGGPSVDASKPRRSIYTKWLRNSRDPLLESFDPPDAYNSTAQRNVTTTPMQSLVMLNGPYVLQRAQALANRLQTLHLSDQPALVSAAYRLVYGREPSPSESSAGVKFLVEQARSVAHNQQKLAQLSVERMPGHPGSAALFKTSDGQTRLQVPDNHLMPQYDFTAEAFILLHSVDNSGAPRTILSRWDGRDNQPGWSLAVSGKHSETGAPVLVLELIGDPAEDGAAGHETISSGIPIALDVPCYVGVSIRIGDTSDTGVTFYSQPLQGGAPLQVTHRPHRVTANHQSNLPLVIGGRDPDKHVAWDGLIDDVRLSRQALKHDDLLLARDHALESTVGYWRFEHPDLLKDSSPNGHDIKAEVSPSAQSDPNTAALVDFCHVLLNSNEFLYVE